MIENLLKNGSQEHATFLCDAPSGLRIGQFFSKVELSMAFVHVLDGFSVVFDGS